MNAKEKRKLEKAEKLETEKLKAEKLETEKLETETEKPGIETETETALISSDEKASIEKATIEFLNTQNVEINQTVDHLTFYKKASELMETGKFTEIAESGLTAEKASFDTVQSWFASLKFPEISTAGESLQIIFEMIQEISTASFKKANTKSKLNTYFSKLAFSDLEALTVEQCKTLLQASLYLKGTGSGVTSEGKNQNPENFKGDRGEFHKLFGKAGTYQLKESEFDFQGKKTGKAGFNAYLSKFGSLYRNSGYGDLQVNRQAGTFTVTKNAEWKAETEKAS